ncbi:MAG: DUF6263 family protein [Rubinisphaera brasiliensis]|uniref:DUF6263 family protein n=1 Tax=Rubinisphaera brasiliensis TaxID=119 RepID=UPI003919F4B3
MACMPALQTRMFRAASLLLALVCCSSIADAQTQLQYRYESGDTLSYELRQTLTTTANISGQPMENIMSQQLELSTHVQNVSADGSAEVTKRINRIRMRATQPGRDEPLTYDSQTETDVPAPFRMIADSMSRLVNQDIQMTLSPEGEASDVQLPDSMNNLINGAAGGIAGVNSPEGVKKMISQGSLIFPQRAVAVNESWTRELSTDLPFGTMKSNVILTYAGQTPEGLHRIDAKSKISLIPKEGTPFQVTLKSADGQGVYLFDESRGCVYASALKQQMDLEMSALGQTIKQNVVTDITMRLVEQNTRTAGRP